MVDLKKIDAFFEDASLFEKKTRRRLDRRAHFLRFLKLFMPSVAAVLIALILLFPSIKKNTFVPQSKLAMPKLEDIEKLHIEQTSFFMTDVDGKISTFTADLMEETETGSKVVKITNPKGKIALNAEDKFADVRANTGFYNQETNKIEAKEEVFAVYDNSTILKTFQAEYDFSKAVGEGKYPVYAEGQWGKLWAEGFLYDKNQDILYLNGKTKIVHDDTVLDALKQVIYEKKLSRITALGNVIVTEPDKTLYADEVSLLTTGEKDGEKIKKIEAFGNVRVKAGEGEIKGDKGLYEPDKNLLELEGNVVIKKDNNLIYGDKAVFDTSTSVGRMLSYSKNNRVTGVIRDASIRVKQNEKK